MAAVVALLGSLVGVQFANAQLAQNDIVLGRTTATSTFRVYDKSADAWSQGPGWSGAFIQSIEFDNGNHISHNASGNLFGVNFGNAFNGFEMFNLATNGSSNSHSVWSTLR